MWILQNYHVLRKGPCQRYIVDDQVFITAERTKLLVVDVFFCIEWVSRVTNGKYSIQSACSRLNCLLLFEKWQVNKTQMRIVYNFVWVVKAC